MAILDLDDLMQFIFASRGVDICLVRNLPKKELQELVRVCADSNRSYDRTRYDLIYRLGDIAIGSGQVDVIDHRHERCFENGFKMFPGIKRQAFYPHLYIEGLQRIGIGTVAYIKTLLKVIEQDGHIIPATKVRDSGLLDDGWYLGKALNVHTRMTVQEQLKNAIAYAKTKGFEFQNPFP